MSADDKLVREWLGPRRFVADVRKRTSEPGVATGLAVTAIGGDVLFIEATAYPGRRATEGDGPARRGDAGVCAGRALLGAHARRLLGIDPQWFGENDVHVHVPAGAVPKDGPSAGVTMATAIASVATGKPVSEEVAMTGEVTLSGQVLPIGGLREKVLAAQRAGIPKVLFPRENESDLEELPPETRKDIEFIPVDWIQEVLEGAFDGSPSPGRAAAPAPLATSRAGVTAASRRNSARHGPDLRRCSRASQPSQRGLSAMRVQSLGHDPKGI